ncbi:PREDICTED: ankyrin repeat and SAM domain-containing protein 6-like isoform X2 [Tarenaya hassleriana]|uniref:ankyrin repeat and SAM domain-containing protein 6-like isoform X2 n=1 Tax=Tarenaya hassleriana TaxID=28532 RepID=UPI00053C8EF5|nr:PREDICTED: ankyrin repeat and SAM domain-containing protein 6-like isoform X2 [Tarenaya hassleriana]
MYADRLEADATSRKTVKDRLNGGSGDFSSRHGQVTGKRQRQDDKWEHDLFEEDERRLSSRADPRDLRLKLQKKQHGSQSGQGAGSGVRDLREKLSGTMNPQPRNSDPPKSKGEAARPVMKSVAVEAPGAETKRTSDQSTRRKSRQTADASVESFLESLGLEKYSINFQAEEVDTDALLHMTDDDLKAMSIPMGPRKKILLALASKH